MPSNPKLVFLSDCPNSVFVRDHSKYTCVQILPREGGKTTSFENRWCAKKPTGFVYWTFEDGLMVLNYFCAEHLSAQVCKVFRGDNIIVDSETKGIYTMKKEDFMKGEEAKEAVGPPPFIGSNLLEQGQK